MGTIKRPLQGFGVGYFYRKIGPGRCPEYFINLYNRPIRVAGVFYEKPLSAHTEGRFHLLNAKIDIVRVVKEVGRFEELGDEETAPTLQVP